MHSGFSVGFYLQPTLTMQWGKFQNQCAQRDLCNEFSLLIQHEEAWHNSFRNTRTQRKSPAELKRAVPLRARLHSVKKLSFCSLHAWQTRLDICVSKCAVNVLWNSLTSQGTGVTFGHRKKQQPEFRMDLFMVQETSLGKCPILFWLRGETCLQSKGPSPRR